MQLTITINASAVDGWGFYLHEKNHFVFNALGLYKNAYVYSNLATYPTYYCRVMKVIDVEATHASYINDEKSICQSSPQNESIDLCIQRFIEGEIGCELPWLKNDSSDDTLTKCDSVQYKHYQKLYDEIVASSENTVSKATGCVPSCHRNEFKSRVLERFVDPDLPCTGAPETTPTGTPMPTTTATSPTTTTTPPTPTVTTPPTPMVPRGVKER